MQAETLAAIVAGAEEIELVDGESRPIEGRELTVFLGKPGSAMAVNHVLGLLPTEAYVRIRTRDGGALYTAHDSVQALACREKGATGSKRNMGF